MENKKPGQHAVTGHCMDLTTGRLGCKILLFVLPLVLMNILQQLFNTADIAVVGRLIGKEALAAVGATGSVVTLFINIYSGLSVGANAVLARKIGAGDEEAVGKTAHVSLAIALCSGVLTLAVGELITRPLLVLMGTPAEVLELAVLYLRIYFLGSPFVMLYNFEAAIFRAAGDTRRPLFILLFSGMLNLGLNVFFVTACGMSVDGVAFATLLSNLFSAILLFLMLEKEEGALRIRLHQIRFYRGIPGEILMIGIPSAVQGVLFNIGNMVIQSGINSLGTVAVAGSTIGMNVEVFPNYVIGGFGQACITFTGQNLGARKLDRCIRSLRWCMGLGCAFSLTASAVIVPCRYILAGLFTTDEDIIRAAGVRIAIIVGFQVIRMISEIYSGALRGYGHSVSPALLSLFFVCGVRIMWLFVAFPHCRTLAGLLAVYPVSCTLAAISIAIAYLIIRRNAYPSEASV